MKLFFLSLAFLFLAACGNKVEGIYTDKLGLTEYEFRSGGKLYLRTLGTETELKYAVDGNKITVDLPNGGNQVLTLLDNGHLQGPLNITLEKKK